MRAIPVLLTSALLLGLTGGYAWSMLSSPAPKATHMPKPKMIAIAPSPEEMPEDADTQWTAEADDSVHYAGCNDARAAGKAPLRTGEPGSRADMDGEGDGIACEPHPA